MAEKNKVRFGLSNVHIAYIKEIDAETGKVTYDVPKPLRGAVTLTTDADGEDYKFYADNYAYYAESTNNGYTGDLEVALLPKDHAVEMLGWKLDEDGALIEVANGKGKGFALLGQFEGDVEGGRVCYYHVKAGRPNKEYSTTSDTKDVVTETIPLMIMPLKVEGDNFITQKLMEKSDNPTKYKSFFTAVEMPKFTSEE